MLTFRRTFVILPEYVELNQNAKRPLSPGASCGVSLTRISPLTLVTAPKSSALAVGTSRATTRRTPRARAAARMMRAEAARPSYTDRGKGRSPRQHHHRANARYRGPDD